MQSFFLEDSHSGLKLRSRSAEEGKTEEEARAEEDGVQKGRHVLRLAATLTRQLLF